MSESDWKILQLCKDYCSCGTPDPLDHTEKCPCSLPLDILEEVEELVA